MEVSSLALWNQSSCRYLADFQHPNTEASRHGAPATAVAEQRTPLWQTLGWDWRCWQLQPRWQVMDQGKPRFFGKSWKLIQWLMIYEKNVGADSIYLQDDYEWNYWICIKWSSRIARIAVPQQPITQNQLWAPHNLLARSVWVILRYSFLFFLNSCASWHHWVKIWECLCGVCVCASNNTKNKRKTVRPCLRPTKL